MRLSSFLVVAVVLSLVPQRAQGWGQEGHRLIAAIAARNLNSKAAEQVKQLLAAGETLESISSWADRVRPDRPETSTWHYINIPVQQARIGDSEDQWKQYCPASGCVTGIVGEMAARLSDRNLSKEQRAETLKFLVHFVGDMHQPLHVGDMGDRGGNGVAVMYRGRASNLHSVWDTPMLMDWLGAHPGLKEKTAKGPGFWTRRSMKKGTIADWTWESHDIARDVAYRDLPTTRPAEIGDAYLAIAGPVITKQIERAGVRLARILNAGLGGGNF